jgi:hypothetical protein
VRVGTGGSIGLTVPPFLSDFQGEFVVPISMDYCQPRPVVYSCLCFDTIGIEFHVDAADDAVDEARATAQRARPKPRRDLKCRDFNISDDRSNQALGVIAASYTGTDEDFLAHPERAGRCAFSPRVR